MRAMSASVSSSSSTCAIPIYIDASVRELAGVSRLGIVKKKRNT